MFNKNYEYVLQFIKHWSEVLRRMQEQHLWFSIITKFAHVITIMYMFKLLIILQLDWTSQMPHNHPDTLQLAMLKGKGKEVLVKFTSELRDATCQWDHTVLSATRQRCLCHHPNQAGWYSIYRPRKDERLSWPVTYLDGLPSTDGHPSRYKPGLT